MFGSSPRLIAAYHVFLRLSASRHPPVALNILSLKNFSLPYPYAIFKEPRAPKNPLPSTARLTTGIYFRLLPNDGREYEMNAPVGGGERD